jgi:hypothetical protein
MLHPKIGALPTLKTVQRVVILECRPGRVPAVIVNALLLSALQYLSPGYVMSLNCGINSSNSSAHNNKSYPMQLDV